MPCCQLGREPRTWATALADHVAVGAVRGDEAGHGDGAWEAEGQEAHRKAGVSEPASL